MVGFEPTTTRSIGEVSHLYATTVKLAGPTGPAPANFHSDSVVARLLCPRPRKYYLQLSKFQYYLAPEGSVYLSLSKSPNTTCSNCNSDILPCTPVQQVPLNSSGKTWLAEKDLNLQSLAPEASAIIQLRYRPFLNLFIFSLRLISSSF